MHIKELPQDMGRVAVLFGGDSAEREVSLKSGQAVYEALLKAGIDAIPFDPAQTPLTELATSGIDRALIMLHGRGGEDGTIQGALEFLKIPYTGSGVLGSALAMDKVRSKAIFEARGLPTAKYHVVNKADVTDLNAAEIMSDFGGQVMVKPSLEGSSIGMTRVQQPEQLQEAIETALEFDDAVLLERYIVGREFTVSILNDEALPSIRMETPRSFYDYKAKYQTDTTSYHCPSGVAQKEEARLAELATQAFKAVGASGWGRVDLMQDQQGNLYLLEVNTVPGMTEKSLVPMAAKAAGLSFQQLVLNILQSSETSR